MHPARKFSQNSCKNKTLSIQSTYNKENDKNSMTESFAKKFSLGNHVISNEGDPFQNKKSICDQKISVFLQQSQSKALAIEKPSNQNEIRNLNRILQISEGSVVEVLCQGIEKNQFKSQDVKNLVYTLIQKLSQQQKSISDYSQDSFKLNDHIIRPYLQQELILMKQNLSKLKKREKDIADVKALSQTDKNYLKKNLKELFQQQKRELEDLKSVSCC